MSEPKRLMIYPFQPADVPFVKYFQAFRKDFRIAHICAPPGTGLIGRDYAYGCAHEPLGQTVEDSGALAGSDALLILSEGSAELHGEICSLIMQALSAGKEVFCYARLTETERDELLQFSREKGVPFHWEYGQDWNSTAQAEYRYMYKPSAPVVFVGGIVEDMDQREILLGMAAAFRSRGLKVSVLSQSPSDEFLGCCSCRDLREASLTDGAKRINRLFKAVEQREFPDIILAELPGTMIRFNDMAVGDFGGYAYLFSQAVQADYCICSVFPDVYSREFAESLSEDFRQRFNFPVDAFHLANCLMDSVETINRKTLCMVRIGHEKAAAEWRALRKSADIPCYDLTQEAERERCAEQILNTLS